MSQDAGLSKGPVPYRILNPLKTYTSSTYSVEALFRWIEDGTLDLNPEYQRAVVWPEKKQVGLIDSIFRNFHIPPLVFAKTSDDEGFVYRVCIDGKQRLTSLQNFITGKLPHPNPACPKDKWWFKQLDDKPGYQLSKAMRDLFSQKQIVCIEYEALDDKQQREIFRRVQLGVALNVAERLKALDLTPKSILVRDLALEHATTLREINFTVKRDQETRWFATALLTTYRSAHEKVSLSNVSHERVRKWLEEPLESLEHWETFSARFISSIDLLINIVISYRRALLVDRPPLTVAPVDLVAMIHLVFTFKERFSEADLARAIQRMRNLARVQFKDLRWNSKCIEPYAKFIDDFDVQGLSLLGEEDEEKEESDRGGDQDELEEGTPAPPQPNVNPTSAQASPRKRPAPSSQIPPAQQSPRAPPASQSSRVPPAPQPTAPFTPRSQPAYPSTPRSEHVQSQVGGWSVKLEPQSGRSTQSPQSPQSPQLMPIAPSRAHVAELPRTPAASMQQLNASPTDDRLQYRQQHFGAPPGSLPLTPTPDMRSHSMKRVYSFGTQEDPRKRPRE